LGAAPWGLSDFFFAPQWRLLGEHEAGAPNPTFVQLLAGNGFEPAHEEDEVAVFPVALQVSAVLTLNHALPKPFFSQRELKLIFHF
jgi:hypothetical protein